MLDLNTIITQALTTIVTNAVNEQTKPMLAHIAEQDERIAALQERTIKQGALIIELSNRIAAWQDTQAQPTQETNLLPIEQRLYTVDQVKAIVAQEVHAAIEHHLENTTHLNVDDVVEVVDDKIGDHCNDYDHDSFLTEIDEDAVRDAVRDCLEDARVSISVR